MSKYKTVYGVYYIRKDRQLGQSNFFDSVSEANWYSKIYLTPEWESYVLEQTYELED